MANHKMTTLVALMFMTFSALSASALGTVYIVRHAEKMLIDKEPNPPLSEAGLKRAKDLAHVLRTAELKAIYVTEFKRTHETAGPTADAMGLVPIPTKALEPEKLAEVLKQKHSDESVLVVGHSNLTVLLKALGVTDAVKVTENDYDNLFIVDQNGDGGAVLHKLHYGATSN